MTATTKPTISLADLGTKHPDALAWIIANDGKRSFATDLRAKLKKFKVLTEGQLAAVQKIMTGATPAVATTEVDAGAMAAVQAAFDSAIESGIKRPKLRLATFVLSPAKARTPARSMSTMPSSWARRAVSSTWARSWPGSSRR